jgi:nitronate monooxygenase
MWPDRRLIELFKIELPIVQAPMAGAMDWELAAEAAAAGALGSLPCAMLNADQVREQMARLRARTRNPVNLGFFCHSPPALNNAREARWRERCVLIIRSSQSTRRTPLRPATAPRSTRRCARWSRKQSRKS